MDDSAVVIEFDTLHDQVGLPRTDGRLLIENGRVTGLLPNESAIPPGATQFRGKTVVPGLINAHAHLEHDGGPDPATMIATTPPTRRAIAAAAHARSALHSGVTTLRDLGSSSNIAIETRDTIATGLIDGPTVLATGRVICMTGGHGNFAGREADGPWAVRQAVRSELANGADCIKFIATGGVITPGAVPARAQLSEEELTAGVDEAHRHGLKCTAHAIGARGIINAVRAGVDSIEHGFLIDDEGIELMLKHGTPLVPTLNALRSILDADAEALPAWIRTKASEIAHHAEDNLRRARDAGVAIVAGSDAGTPFNAHDGYRHELQLMQTMLGVTPEQTLRAATRRGGITGSRSWHPLAWQRR
jgi:imidazolonepropionase-like amidohydrolase